MEGKHNERLILPPVTVPFKWLVATLTIAGSALCGVVTIGIWVGSQSTKVEAHGKAIEKLETDTGNLVPAVAKIQGILEYAFPRQAQKYEADQK